MLKQRSAQAASGLFDLHIIADEELTQCEGGQDRRGIGAGPEHDALADDFPRSIVPLPLSRGTPEAVDAAEHVGFLIVVESGSPRFVCEFMFRAGLAEDAEVIADAHALL